MSQSAQLKPTITASPKAATALLKRQLAAGLEAMRSRVEVEGSQGAALARAEQHLFNKRYQQAGEILRDIEMALDYRLKAAEAAASLTRAMDLADAKGEATERGAANEQGRVLSRDGLLWLKQKKKLPQSELMALEKYRELCTRIYAGPVVSGFGEGASGARLPGFAPTEARTIALHEITGARERALYRDRAMIWLVDEVAGKGETLVSLAKGDKHEATRLEHELRVAARLLARHFGFASR